MNRLLLIVLAAVAVLSACCSGPADSDGASPPGSNPVAGGSARSNDPQTPAVTDQMSDPNASVPADTRIATFGAGCFWCVEAVLEQVEGVVDVESGYMGGHVEDPSYEAVCSGTTGHAEVVQVTFDPAKISYDDLLAWFWQLHDPTTLNRQGNDIGTQYRSAIFFHSDAQRDAAIAAKAAAKSKFLTPIVTEIVAAGAFYSAGQYHQDYYRANKQQGYCRAIIAPKLDKLGLEK